MTRPRILIAGARHLRHEIEALLAHLPVDLQNTFATAADLPAQLSPPPDLVIIALTSGFDEYLPMIREIRRSDRPPEVIVVTDRSTEELAVTALRAGITHYVRLPCESSDLVSDVTRSLARCAGAAESATARSSPLLAEELRMIGVSPAVRSLRNQLAQMAGSESNVLITGETGTGKDLIAEMVHRSSRRAHQVLMCINCAAIPDGLLESELFGHERGAFTGAVQAQPGKLEAARGGTVFFDEIGDMSLQAQAKVLRVIETREMYRVGGRKVIPLDIRLIAATNRDLGPLLEARTFRSDLYFRLNVVHIHLPPLRERREDIHALTDHFIGMLNRSSGVCIEGVTSEALDIMVSYDWPGNVRELRNTLEAAAAAAPTRRIAGCDLPPALQWSSRLKPSATRTPPDTDERMRLLSTLSSENWNKSRTAARLNWSRMRLYRNLKKYGVGGTPSPPER